MKLILNPPITLPPNKDEYFNFETNHIQFFPHHNKHHLAPYNLDKIPKDPATWSRFPRGINIQYCQ